MREGENRLERAPRLSFLAKAALTRARSGAWLLRGSARPPPEGIRILFYHRVSDDRDDLAVRPRRFREQMEALAAEGFRVVDVAEAAALLRRGETVGRTIALSFDDGYLDVAEQALPVLERHGFRASVFLVTGALDGEVEFTWYRRRPPLLGWDDVLRLDGGSPLRFEAHTVTHPSLPGLGDERAREEIAGSK
ncbi:MAG: polysaccharide deacetylase family protein, partial [Gaiellaceae bacterium]